MKKHLFGFALFSLIVGSAVFIAALMYESPVPEKQQFTYEVSKRSCWKNVRQSSEIRQKSNDSHTSVKVIQAFLNEKTKKLNLDFAIQRETPSTQNLKVKLTFISSVLKESGEWRNRVTTDYIELSPNFNVENKAIYSMPYKFPDNLNSSGNLYVSADLGDGVSSNADFTARKVDYSDFTPILLMNKDRNY